MLDSRDDGAVIQYVLTLGFDPDYFLIERVHVFLQLSLLLLHILEGVCQGLDLRFMLDTNQN